MPKAREWQHLFSTALLMRSRQYTGYFQLPEACQGMLPFQKSVDVGIYLSALKLLSTRLNWTDWTGTGMESQKNNQITKKTEKPTHTVMYTSIVSIFEN